MADHGSPAPICRCDTLDSLSPSLAGCRAIAGVNSDLRYAPANDGGADTGLLLLPPRDAAPDRTTRDSGDAEATVATGAALQVSCGDYLQVCCVLTRAREAA
jgi:hypothetical protein